VQPHSALLQFLLEWGIVGTLLFSFVLLKGFIYGLRLHIMNKSLSATPYSIGAGSVIIALSIHGLFDGTYYHPQPSIFLAIAFAIWVSPPIKN
jgi:O-antigen ligase